MLLLARPCGARRGGGENPVITEKLLLARPCGARRYCLINLGNIASIAAFARTSCSSSLLLFYLLHVIAVTDFIPAEYHLYRRQLEVRTQY